MNLKQPTCAPSSLQQAHENLKGTDALERFGAKRDFL